MPPAPCLRLTCAPTPARAYVQDITPREVVRANPKADREVVLYGYLRGTNMKPDARVHVAGVGDFTLQARAGSRGGEEELQAHTPRGRPCTLHVCWF